MEKQRKFCPLYIFAGLYIIGVYTVVPVLYLLNRDVISNDTHGTLTAGSVLLPLLIPVILGLVNLFAVIILRRSVRREQLLNAALAVKYALVPFYLTGGLCIAAAILLIFTPVVIMVFLGPAVALTLGTAGWLILLGSAPFSVGYLARAKKDGVHAPALCITAGVLQFFFTADVVSMMILAIREKKWIRVTVALLILLLTAVIGAVIWLILKINS
ncbi:MAG: hypothetical protein IK134_06485 [Oscillospiraceae bacterium]|nr:hypothetical protein [Oscillospiraceae bacterium]